MMRGGVSQLIRIAQGTCTLSLCRAGNDGRLAFIWAQFALE
jgi:hypothetical protein